MLVAPNAVKKLSGATPSLAARSPDLPPVIAAKLCIDAAGNVTSAEVLSKIEHGAATALAGSLKGWRYAPYQQGGAAVPACFVVSFRLQ